MGEGFPKILQSAEPRENRPNRKGSKRDIQQGVDELLGVLPYREERKKKNPDKAGSDVKWGEEDRKRYIFLLSRYNNLRKKAGALMNRLSHLPNVDAPEIREETQRQSKELHTIHLELMNISRKYKKRAEDVLIDIVRNEGSLEDRDLPEFSLLRSSDIISTGEWHDPFEFKFKDEYKDEGKNESVIDADHLLLIFAITPIFRGDRDYPIDYDERRRRAEAFAEEIGGEIFDLSDSSYHDASVNVLGVTFPKADFEKIVSIVRNNPERFRLGYEFYSPEVKREIDLAKKSQDNEEYDEGDEEEGAGDT